MLISAETRGNAGQSEGELVQTEVTTAQAFPDPKEHEFLDYLLAERASVEEVPEAKKVIQLIEADIETILTKGNQHRDEFVKELVADYLGIDACDYDPNAKLYLPTNPNSNILGMTKRTKTPQALGEKTKRKRVLISPNSPKRIYNVHDTHAIRIFTRNIQTLYDVAGRLNENYKLIPGTLDDYVANPKANGYQTWQGTFLVPKRGEERAAVEVQLRTFAMHLRAEQDNYKVDKVDHKS